MDNGGGNSAVFILDEQDVVIFKRDILYVFFIFRNIQKRSLVFVKCVKK